MVALSGLDTRPTTDRVKESIFNIIMPYLPSDSVLDLFSGSGAMGIEALSRSCGHCVFVEKERAAMAVTEQNIRLARVEDRSETVLSDALAYLSRTTKKFDIIFLDPPYSSGLLTAAINAIAENRLLTPDGIIVAESEYQGEEATNENFDTIKRAKYGKTTVSVLRAKAE